MGTPRDLREEINSRDSKKQEGEKKNMLRELLDRILEIKDSVTVRTEETDGRIYTNRTLTPLRVDLVTALDVQTLTGFFDLSKERLDEAFIHVVSECHVALTSRKVDEWNRRSFFAHAKVPSGPAFRFGIYLEPEDFIIGLQTNFADGQQVIDGSDYLKVQRLVSNLAAESVVIAADDGYSQQVTTREGVVSKSSEKVSPRVTLAPFRTFREVPQPASDFVLRLKSRQNSTPLVALFEADGGEWKNKAIANVRDWLTSRLGAGAMVVA